MVIRSSGRKVGWAVKPQFRIGLHVKDVSLLYRIQAFFGVGNISGAPPAPRGICYLCC
jgi:hypothetical protein